MRAISVRQPDAWLITHGIKDVENRTWSTTHRGWLLIHAGRAKMGPDDWEYLRDTCALNGIDCPVNIEYGGIVGAAYLLDCVDSDESVWFDGPVGWILTGGTPLPLLPTRGRLGLFNVDEYIVEDALTSRSVPRRNLG